MNNLTDFLEQVRDDLKTVLKSAVAQAHILRAERADDQGKAPTEMGVAWTALQQAQADLEQLLKPSAQTPFPELVKNVTLAKAFAEEQNSDFHAIMQPLLAIYNYGHYEIERVDVYGGTCHMQLVSFNGGGRYEHTLQVPMSVVDAPDMLVRAKEHVDNLKRQAVDRKRELDLIEFARLKRELNL